MKLDQQAIRWTQLTVGLLSLNVFSLFPSCVFCELVGGDGPHLCFDVVHCNIACLFRCHTEIWGDLTHPICKDVGTTIFIGSPSACGKTNTKLYSLPSLQHICQNPSFTSRFAINIFMSSSSGASVKACMIWLRL